MEENNAQSVPTERVDDRYDRQMFRILRNIDLNLLTIFEAVYVHNGIVNAAKILNITPSAISQSLNKLRALFPDPLFIRKGQGVTPTAYATHLHKHISQGMEAFLNALDLTGNTQRERVITVATSPAIGALIMPVITKKLRSVFPQILLHNVAITDAASQLNQRQVDLLVDSFPHSGQAITHHVLFQDSVHIFCRAGHPALALPANSANLSQYEFALLQPEGQRYTTILRRLEEHLGERRYGFSSYNLLTQAALVNDSDMLGLITSGMFSLVEKIWPLKMLDFPPLREEKIDIALHYNKLSAQEPLLKEIVETIRQAF
ncbi:YbeF family transcriptional regulator [Klebsiella michiganensis]|uniref:LysR family transcriptional regulator n=1 Tax=Klebsiella michiganensis TaxID=1134687 RepID=A0A2J4ZE91_9ENTR|nr:YbeF family transcriptional regulator [Klebsiella michiganensis]EMB9092274.1 DNA-binding transcriptional regulator [Klebsiella michiganensis]EMD5183400.1 DNA-binding transcriptional regulator [Klebsiella michiganensis]MBQ4653600.1 DNA-binding transcriptional regulator [Klebsiella michiganensis]MBQ4659868.1 DNA-binding transcriptional regulator [Klebsiella michiganensis]MBZ7130884.1 DNA-binding transcriptional regulator [Klebsiella michiganensis]